MVFQCGKYISTEKFSTFWNNCIKSGILDLLKYINVQQINFNTDMKYFNQVNVACIAVVFLLMISSVVSTNAQVVINEFSAANYNNYLCSNNDYEDWIELYNAGAAPVNLAGYYLSDRVANPTKWKIPVGFSIPAKGRLVIIASGLDNTIGGFLHTNFKITQTDAKEAVVLASPSGTVIDFNEIDVPNQKNHAYARMPDGGNWTITKTPTPGAANNSTTLKYAKTPDFDIKAGYYPTAQLVTLETAEPNSTIRYTLDGTEPTSSSTAFVSPININTTKILKAKTFSSDPAILPSHTEMNTYFIGPGSKHTMKIVSISGDQINTLLGGNSGINPEGTFELFDENGQFLDECTGEFNKHGNDSWAYAQRGIDYVARDQFGNDAEIKNQLFPNSKRNKFQRVILKAAANDNYPSANGAHVRDAYVHELAQRAGMDLDVRSVEFCVLYVNGNYWGIYDMREKVDDSDYTDYYYNLDGDEIDFIKTWGGTWAEYGTTANWNTLRTYILANDMTDPVKFQYVADRLNLLSLADYFIINIHTVCKDWLNWNTSWWSGMDASGNKQKWRYTLWDMDATFGHYINYTNIPNVNANADPCDVDKLPPNSDPQSHTDVLAKLFLNKSFHDMYINRYADLNNTYLSCSYMSNLLDEMTGKLAPEMPRQIARWGGNITTWQNNVKFIKDFINSRCVEIEGGLVDCYQLQGPYNLTVIVKPDGSPNNVLVNTLIPGQYPYVGKYYGGTDLNFSAKPGTGWLFDKWESSSIPINPGTQAIDIISQIKKPDTLYAYFVLECPMTIDLQPKGQNFIDCKTTKIPLEVMTSNGSNDYSFTWFDENKTIIADSTKSIIYVSKPGWYYSEVKDNVWDCTRRDSFLVLDKIIYPNVDLQVSAELTCVNNKVDLLTAGTDTGPIFIYNWTGVCLNSPSNSTSNSACKPGKYFLEVTDNSNGCASIDSILVIENIKKPDDVNLVSSSNFIPCDGSGVVLSVSGNGPNGTYTQVWSTKTGNLQGTLTDNSVTATTQSWYYLTITDPLNGCIHIDSVLLKNNDAFISSIDFTLKNPNCAVADNGQIDVIAIGTGTPFTYSLNTGTPTASSSFANLASGSYQIVIENIDKCMFDTTIVLDVVEDLPLEPGLKITGASCDVANNAKIEVTSQTGGVSPYTYSFNQGAYSTQTIFNNLTPGTVNIAIKDDEGCTANYDVTVSISEDLPNKFSELVKNPGCIAASNGSIEIQNISGGQAPYLLNFNNTSFGSSSLISGLAAGNVDVSIKDALGCIFDTTIYVAVVDDLPSIFTTNKTEPACQDGTNGEIEILNISGGQGPYLISLNGSAASSNNVFGDLKIGQQFLVITDANGCEYSTNISLNAGNPLTVDLGADLVVDNGTDIQVTANINGSNIGSIEWTPLICEGCTNAFVTILSDTIFNVLVTDEGGCVAKDQLFVKVKDNADAFTPNVFSPNGDGINDTWRIYSSNPQARVKQLSIYDRWGGMVFTTSGFHPSDNESAWDGTVNGKKCGQGVYVFMAEIELRPGKTIQLKGEILISR